MKLEKAKVMEWNQKAGNGFHFAVRTAIFNDEKELMKQIKLNENKVLEIRLKWEKEENNVIPIIHFQEWVETGEFFSGGFSKSVKIGNATKRKNFNWLLNFSNSNNGLDDTNLMKQWEAMNAAS